MSPASPMSPRTQRLLFWLLLFATLPLPFAGAQSGVAPALRMVFVGSLMASVYLGNPDAMSRLLTLLMLGQGIGYAVMLYGAAWVMVQRLRGGLVAAFALLLLAASLFQIYTLPLSSAGLQSNIVGIFR